MNQKGFINFIPIAMVVLAAILSTACFRHEVKKEWQFDPNKELNEGAPRGNQ